MVRGKCTVEVTVGKRCDLVFAAEFHMQQLCIMVSLSLFLFVCLFVCFQNEPSSTNQFVTGPS